MSACTASMPRSRPSVFVRPGKRRNFTATTSRAATAFMGSAAPASPRACSPNSSASTRSVGWAFWRKAPPSSDELVYTYNERGFALLTMRTREISRLYLQVPFDEDIESWSDDRIWSELRLRTAADGDWKLNEGAIFQKNIAGMRSYVVEPMQYGKMFLAGDAAHIVPPTGAKGLNLAVADVRIMAQGVCGILQNRKNDLLDRYSETCLRRVWKAQRFSWWMTSMLHRFDTDNAFDQRRQIAELDYVTSSRAAMTTLAENYVGLPWD